MPVNYLQTTIRAFNYLSKEMLEDECYNYENIRKKAHFENKENAFVFDFTLNITTEITANVTLKLDYEGKNDLITIKCGYESIEDAPLAHLIKETTREGFLKEWQDRFNELRNLANEDFDALSNRHDRAIPA